MERKRQALHPLEKWVSDTQEEETFGSLQGVILVRDLQLSPNPRIVPPKLLI
jgi:hypothetical protein